MASSASSPARVAYMRAKRGARWLDENFPGWERRINKRTLKLDDGQLCICGQVFKNKTVTGYGYTGYDYAQQHLFQEANSWITKIVPMDRRIRPTAVSIALGFSRGSVMTGLKSDAAYVGWDDLQKAWVKLLKERKAANAN